MRFVTVNYGGWDHHAKIFESLDKKLPEFDQALSAMVTDMHARGAFEEHALGGDGRIRPHAEDEQGRRAGTTGDRRRRCSSPGRA